MKLFKTGSNIVIEECMDAFGVKRLSEGVIRRKMLFLHRYYSTSNICKSFCDRVAVQWTTVIVSFSYVFRM